MATEVDRLIVTLEARMGRYEAEMRRASQMTGQKLTQMEGRFALFARNLKGSASTAALGVGSALGGIGAYLGVQQLQSYADGWTTITRALTASEQAFGMRLRSAEELNKLANESRVDNEAYAKLYIRTAAATRDLGVAEEDVAKVTTSVAQALKLGSASASEQASTMLQLSQALQKGKLDGDEFRTVMENAGIIQELLADKLKVSKGAIIEMAAAGKLKVGQLFAALLEGGDKIDRIFQKMPTTIDEAFTVLGNSLEEYIGKLDQATDASQSLVGMLGSVSRNMETVGDSAAVLGASLLAAFSPRLIAGIGAAGVGIAAAAGTIGLLAAAVAGGATAFALLADNIGISGDGIVTLQDYINATVSVIGDKLQPAIDTMSAAWGVAVDGIIAGLSGIPVSFDQIVAAARTALNMTIGVFSFAAKAIPAAFYYVPNAIGEMMINMANHVLQIMRDLVKSIASVVNTIPGVKMGDLLVEDFANPLAGFGVKARESVAEAGRQLGRDFVGEWGKSLNGMSDEVERRAMAIANGRRLAGSTTTTRDTPAKPIYPSVASAGGKKSPFEREVRQVEESIRALQLENQLLGSNAYEAERARAAQELLNAAKQEGIKVTPQLLAQIDQLSIAYATAKTEAERLKETFEEIKSFSSDALKGFITDLKEGKSGSEALGGALDKLANKLIDMAVNQLVNQALGPLLGGIMGGASANGAGSALSVFGFANGGIAAHGRPQPLPRFASGGISRSAAIFGEAGPEAAVPLPNGRSIPVDLRLPKLPPVAGMGRPDRSEMVVRVVASSEFDAKVEAVAGNVVARAAPEIMKASVGATEKALPGMIGRAQKRKM